MYYQNWQIIESILGRRLMLAKVDQVSNGGVIKSPSEAYDVTDQVVYLVGQLFLKNAGKSYFHSCGKKPYVAGVALVDEAGLHSLQERLGSLKGIEPEEVAKPNFKGSKILGLVSNDSGEDGAYYIAMGKAVRKGKEVLLSQRYQRPMTDFSAVACISWMQDDGHPLLKVADGQYLVYVAGKDCLAVADELKLSEHQVTAMHKVLDRGNAGW